MHIVIVNPILYTAETRDIPQVSSIKDTMIYSMCTGFVQIGCEVTLIAAADYRPVEQETYPFDVVFFDTAWHHICMPHRIPYMPALGSWLDARRDHIDLIIASEVFSLSTYTVARHMPERLIIWQELAAHNHMLHEIPSRLWYRFVVRYGMRDCLVAARSTSAQTFIERYSDRVLPEIIDHGVDLSRFQVNDRKENRFIVCSQLIARKQIDGILRAFADYLQQVDSTTELLIAGDGEERGTLEHLAEELRIADRVGFTGRLDHEAMIPYLSSSLAMLINTRQDANMVSIVESLAVCTPIVTNTVPFSAPYIQANSLGIVRDHWDWKDLQDVRDHNAEYVAACTAYRPTLSVEYKAQQFLTAARDVLQIDTDSVPAE